MTLRTGMVAVVSSARVVFVRFVILPPPPVR